MEVDEEGGPAAGSSTDPPARLVELKANLDKRFGKFLRQHEYWDQSVQTLVKRVCIDWHLTLEVDEEVPSFNVRELQLLQDQGFALILCSYCGQSREDCVRKQVSSLEESSGIFFERKVFTRVPLGKSGKTYAALSQGCGLLIDDRKDVCREALTKGISAYPIQTEKQSHEWIRAWGRQPYMTFWDAAKAIVEEYGSNV